MLHNTYCSTPSQSDLQGLWRHAKRVGKRLTASQWVQHTYGIVFLPPGRVDDTVGRATVSFSGVNSRLLKPQLSRPTGTAAASRNCPPVKDASQWFTHTYGIVFLPQGRANDTVGRVTASCSGVNTRRPKAQFSRPAGTAATTRSCPPVKEAPQWVHHTYGIVFLPPGRVDDTEGRATASFSGGGNTRLLKPQLSRPTGTAATPRSCPPVKEASQWFTHTYGIVFLPQGRANDTVGRVTASCSGVNTRLLKAQFSRPAGTAATPRSCPPVKEASQWFTHTYGIVFLPQGRANDTVDKVTASCSGVNTRMVKSQFSRPAGTAATSRSCPPVTCFIN